MAFKAILPVLACALAGPLAAQGTAPADDPAEAILTEMRAACAGHPGGLRGPGQTWAPLDLGPGGPAAEIFVSTDWGCPEPPGFFWHTGGGTILLRAEGQVFRATARGWTVAQVLNVGVVILSRHGTDCGGAGYQPCFEAVSWSDGRWLSVRNQPEDG